MPLVLVPKGEVFKKQGQHVWAYRIVFEGASVETQNSDFSEPVIVIYMYSLLEFGKVGRIYRHEARSKKYV